MIITAYSGARGSGKTTWLISQMEKAIGDGLKVAVLVPSTIHREPFGMLGHNYTEATFERARSGCYDHIYVDNADLFKNDPLDLCKQVTPGAPVTMTYTPSARLTLRILATPPDLPVSEPILSQRDQEYLVMLLAVKTGESLRRIRESGIVESAIAAGLLRKLISDFQ